MYCRKCEYPLGQTKATHGDCPECGCAFDATDPKTFAVHPDRLRLFRKLGWSAAALTAIAPAGYLVTVGMVYVSAVRHLGRAPDVYAEYPDDWGPVAGYAVGQGILDWLFVAGLISWIAGVVAMFGYYIVWSAIRLPDHETTARRLAALRPFALMGAVAVAPFVASMFGDIFWWWE